MSYRVFVTASVANLRQDGTGSRRVLLANGDILEFWRTPTVMGELPPEVEADEYLVKEEIAEEVETTEAPVNPTGDLSALKWPALVAKAKALDISPTGKKREALEAEVSEALAAKASVEEEQRKLAEAEAQAEAEAKKLAEDDGA